MKTCISTTCLLLLLALASCKKGKMLPRHLSVKFTPMSTALVNPNGDPTFVDPDTKVETSISPKYTGGYSGAQVSSDFGNHLKELLSDNNIFLVDSDEQYELQLSALVLEETMDSHGYFDSCTMSRQYYQQSYLRVTVTASLYKNGMEVDSWTRVVKSQETVKNRTDRCNRPKIRQALRGPSALLDQAAKDLREKISKKLCFELCS